MRSVNVAFGLWIFALAAGVFETVLAIAEMPAGESYTAGVIVRVVVTAVALFFAVKMRAGKNWARLTLAIGLGIIGTLSLVVEPIQWLLDGNSLNAAISRAGTMTLIFAGSRILHLTAVLSATVLMFTPVANRHFRRALDS